MTITATRGSAARTLLPSTTKSRLARHSPMLSKLVRHRPHIEGCPFAPLAITSPGISCMFIIARNRPDDYIEMSSQLLTKDSGVQQGIGRRRAIRFPLVFRTLYYCNEARAVGLDRVGIIACQHDDRSFWNVFLVGSPTLEAVSQARVPLNCLS